MCKQRCYLFFIRKKKLTQTVQQNISDNSSSVSRASNFRKLSCSLASSLSNFFIISSNESIALSTFSFVIVAQCLKGILSKFHGKIVAK